MTEKFRILYESIPKHLRQYVVDQNYDRYTWQDQAVWRYIMRRNIDFLKKHAHPAYMEGLSKTGISINHVPDIDEMNDCLERIGWKAVIVDGFLPPAVFMEFQYHKILVISADIRNIKHVLYTPAPDIVHEAAGHAPIIADEKYSEFLQKFGYYGTKAFSSKLDQEIYEAIRYLSIIKEYPETTDKEIEDAEKDLAEKIEQNTNPSEMTKLSRLHWWTVEYGLIGNVEDYKLYGAGLLSSVGESKNCMGPRVKKLPLTIECTEYNYDITKEQPQLFVNRDWQHLLDVLEEFADGMSFRIGGAFGLRKALESGTEATCQYSSGLQVSGLFKDAIINGDEPVYIKTEGPTSLSWKNHVLEGHGPAYHKEGYGSPVGVLEDNPKPLEDMTEAELEQFQNDDGIYDLRFEGGVRVRGELTKTLRENGKNLLMTFTNCTVTGPDNETLFLPEWGEYDMALGAELPSVFAGTADKLKHNVFPEKSKRKAIPIKHSDKEKSLHLLYKEVRDMRLQKTAELPKLSEIFNMVRDNYKGEWLLPLEIYELAREMDGSDALKTELMSHLDKVKQTSDELDNIISSGLELLEKSGA